MGAPRPRIDRRRRVTGSRCGHLGKRLDCVGLALAIGRLAVPAMTLIAVRASLGATCSGAAIAGSARRLTAYLPASGEESVPSHSGVATAEGPHGTEARRAARDRRGATFGASVVCDGEVSQGRRSGYPGRPSSGSSYQGAHESTKMWYCGRIAGSSSSVPRRTPMNGPSGHCPRPRVDPQVRQNTTGEPPSAGV